jgi:ornithine cyclodeaminase
VERVRLAYAAHHAQQSVIPCSPFLCVPHNPRARIIPAPDYLGMSFDVAGIKWVASFPDNIQHNVPRASALLALNNPDTSYPYAVLEGSIISAARTAASAVLAA